MKRNLLLLVCLALLLVALPLHAQSDEEVCLSGFPAEDYEVIVEACSAWLEINPLSLDAFFYRAYAQTELGNYEEAIVDYSKYLLLDSKSSIAFNNRGYVYALSGQLEEAIRDYTRAILVDAGYTLALLNRAYAYSDAGEFENALADAEQLAELEPDNYSVFDLLGSIYIDQGEYEAAIDAYTQFIGVAPDQANGYLGRGFAYWSQGDYERAAPDYLAWVDSTAPNSEAIDPVDALEPFTVTFLEGTHYTLEIEAEAGQILRATAAGRRGIVDPMLILIDPDGTPITMDDDSGGGLGELDATIEDFELPEDGTYLLIIGYAGGGSFGDVRVDVRLSDGE